MGAVELQIVQLRVEIRDEFSAIRREMVTKDEFRAEVATLRVEMATKAELQQVRLELQEDIAALGRDVAARILESENRTRVLFEDVVNRIVTGREGYPRN